MSNYTIFQMLENPRRGRQAINFTTNVPKILDLKLSFEQIFSKNCRWVPLCYYVCWVGQSLGCYFVEIVSRFACLKCQAVFWPLRYYACQVGQSLGKKKKKNARSQVNHWAATLQTLSVASLVLMLGGYFCNFIIMPVGQVNYWAATLLTLCLVSLLLMLGGFFNNFVIMPVGQVNYWAATLLTLYISRFPYLNVRRFFQQFYYYACWVGQLLGCYFVDIMSRFATLDVRRFF